MGQRHQVYLRTKDKYYNENNPNNKKAKTFALHHQWLYGHTAIRLLHNYLKFLEIDFKETYSKCDDPDEAFQILQQAYSFDYAKGYSHGVIDITDDCAHDPLRGDNNNGITVIDFEHGKVKYAFLSLHGLECMDESVKHPDDCGWDFDDEDTPDMDLRLQYQNFEPIDVNHWMNLHYGRNWDDNSKESKEIRKLIKFVNKFEVLSENRLGEIFPELVTTTKGGQGFYLKPNSVEFMEEKAQTELEFKGA